ncbi:MAG: hypothetical protein K0R48_1510 [Gammaproteobacteria bacterium]|jgi:hypothetical protein|nr:hypothetical protein [Gammaproteobacteria bacterium]
MGTVNRLNPAELSLRACEAIQENMSKEIKPSLQ